MKRLVFTLSLLLVACGTAEQTVSTLTASVDTEHLAQATELFDASVRVVERRLASYEEELLDHTIAPAESSATLTFAASNPDALTQVLSDMQEPFLFSFMIETTEEDADVVVEGQGAFKETGITEEDILWTTVSQQDNGRARVEVTMTEEGKAKLATLYAENTGKALGMFVRKLLVSKLIVKPEALQERIVINDIPSLEIAQAFSDDVNVGVAVSFSQPQ